VRVGVAKGIAGLVRTRQLLEEAAKLGPGVARIRLEREAGRVGVARRLEPPAPVQERGKVQVGLSKVRIEI
jgi:hypothetical protein